MLLRFSYSCGKKSELLSTGSLQWLYWTGKIDSLGDLLSC